MTAQATAAVAKAQAKKAVFDWQDPLLLDDALSEEERMLRDSARDFCQAFSSCSDRPVTGALRRPRSGLAWLTDLASHQKRFSQCPWYGRPTRRRVGCRRFSSHEGCGESSS